MSNHKVTSIIGFYKVGLAGQDS